MACVPRNGKGKGRGQENPIKRNPQPFALDLHSISRPAKANGDIHQSLQLKQEWVM